MNIVAIGGGESGRIGTLYETKLFDQLIVSLTKKDKPNLLFISFSQNTKDSADSYYQLIKHNYSNLGCNSTHLSEEDLIDINIVKNKIKSADIIYVGGGDTLRLMNIIRRYNIDTLLKEAGDSGTILCGISAGAICWCNYGTSKSRKYISNPYKQIKVKGLGIIPILFCPHYDEEVRQIELQRIMRTTKEVSIALDSCVAIHINGNRYKIIKSKEHCNAYKCYWSKGQYIKYELSEEGTIRELLSKCK